MASTRQRLPLSRLAQLGSQIHLGQLTIDTTTLFLIALIPITLLAFSFLRLQLVSNGTRLSLSIADQEMLREKRQQEKGLQLAILGQATTLDKVRKRAREIGMVPAEKSIYLTLDTLPSNNGQPPASAGDKPVGVSSSGPPLSSLEMPPEIVNWWHLATSGWQGILQKVKFW
ncbi:MAG: hypothetical protein EXR62_08390 [Chloroflexi bacterium]|nr:hypothetical protein [Chloroflexota bacterium]